MIPTSTIPPDHLDFANASGLSDAQAQAIWRVVAEVRTGRFDALAAHRELMAGGYTATEADVLIEEVLERLARAMPANTNTA